MDLDEFRRSLDDWLDQNEHDLRADPAAKDTLDDQMAQLAKVKRLTYEAGFMRRGWPERVGGLGGSSLLRAPTWVRRSPRGAWWNPASTP